MQRTVGPCHRDRKQKRSEKSEERRCHSRWGRGGRGRGVTGGGRAPSRHSSVVGQPGQEGTRQQVLLKGVDYTKRAGHLALGRGRKGESAKATVSAQRTEGRKGGESQSRQDQATGTSKTRKTACVPKCLEPA